MNFFKSLFVVIILFTTTNQLFSQTTTLAEIDNLKTTIVKVKGITCSMDLKMITSNVEKIEGISSCIVQKQGATTTFEVKYNSILVTEKEIFTAIENTGSCENPSEKPYKVKL
jgi:copper chaperone CopZ